MLRRVYVLCSLAVVGMACFPGRLAGQELPYFVTYSHHMEEPGSLDFELKTASGRPHEGDTFLGTSLEFEYGTRAWWTTELYLDGQSTAGESTVFGGFRLENRFRPLLGEHRVNPVLYVEFEDINGANKSLLEVVGHDGAADLVENNRDTHAEKEREIELKLIFSSNAKGWNFAENVIAEKNLSNDPWEFGYALAASRPLRLTASGRNCRLCAEDFQLGVEMYGGLGDRYSFGTRDTSHYVAPTANWNVPHGPTLSFSPAFGLNDQSLPHIYRIGISYEPGQVRRWFHARKEGR
ncbi:MAG TPA: hypothetical protein VGU46_08960 [Acidobacteriaceae bacterium]|nr:hypothetical protein [Acidobacteriaceae bacterium]